MKLFGPGVFMRAILLHSGIVVRVSAEIESRGYIEVIGPAADERTGSGETGWLLACKEAEG